MVNQVRINYAFIKYNTKDEYNYGKIYEVPYQYYSILISITRVNLWVAFSYRLSTFVFNHLIQLISCIFI